MATVSASIGPNKAVTADDDTQEFIRGLEMSARKVHRDEVADPDDMFHWTPCFLRAQHNNIDTNPPSRQTLRAGDTNVLAVTI